MTQLGNLQLHNNAMPEGHRRVHVIVRGLVQGVGFRPFVYRLATDLGLVGWVNNTTTGVVIEVQGTACGVDEFLIRLRKDKPELSRIDACEWNAIKLANESGFSIIDSDRQGNKTTLILPDIATCRQCLRDVFDPGNRRYLYPFTNCTNCGPRFSIIEQLPYDRPNTSMSAFKMCLDCQVEYADPANRRFHAQPNACPRCGPHLELWDDKGVSLSSEHAAVLEACRYMSAGAIVAIKGIGGFHLLVNALDDSAVARLRKRKQREEKPLAVMFPYIRTAAAECTLSSLERQLMLSPAAPIVLLRRRAGRSTQLATSIAPENPYVGAMLPYSPLHHIVMNEVGYPVVATSGNISDEPICIDSQEALQRLKGIADIFLIHNRPIVRPLDDSVVIATKGYLQVFRRARGYAPLPITLNSDTQQTLAVGAHLKNTTAVSRDRHVFVSQHNGDLTHAASLAAFRQGADDLANLYDVKPSMIAHDLHPDYLSTRYASSLTKVSHPVQHHYAHVLSCMAEHGLRGDVLGVSWDGTGLGPDRTIWGGEFLLATAQGYERVARLRRFKLPGGDSASKEPRRSAIGLLYELFGKDTRTVSWLETIRSYGRGELQLLLDALERGVNAPYCSSMGRLFDAVCSIIGLRQVSTFEGQAAMMLEHLLADTEQSYSLGVYDVGVSACSWYIDWEPMVRNILADLGRGTPSCLISAKFHNALVACVVGVARLVGKDV